MSSYQEFTSTRNTEPDLASLINQLRAQDASAGVQHIGGTQVYVIKKSTAWTSPQITAVQSIIDNAVASTPALTAQTQINNMSIMEKALILTILDQFNLIRSKLAPPLAPITTQQMIDAWIAKAGTL